MKGLQQRLLENIHSPNTRVKTDVLWWRSRKSPFAGARPSAFKAIMEELACALGKRLPLSSLTRTFLWGSVPSRRKILQDRAQRLGYLLRLWRRTCGSPRSWGRDSGDSCRVCCGRGGPGTRKEGYRQMDHESKWLCRRGYGDSGSGGK